VIDAEGSPGLQTARAAYRVPGELALLLGVSVDWLAAHNVAAEMRTVRRGKVVLVSASEVARWLDRNAARLSDR
jgi:hypothetical protein